MQRTIFGRSLALLAAAILVAALAVGGLGFGLLGSSYERSSLESLERAASGLAAACPFGSPAPATGATSSGDAEAAGRELASWCSKIASSSGYRVTLIRSDGSVAADSEADPATMANHAGRPEVAAALAGSVGSARRKSATIGIQMIYAAAPIPGGPRSAALRLALAQSGIEAALARSRWAMALLVLAFAAAAFAAAAAFSRSLSKPLSAIARAADEYGAGEAIQRGQAAAALGPKEPFEIRRLAVALDSMAEEIEERMGAAGEERAQLEAVLDAMADVLIALDSSLSISIANPAARSIFSLPGGGIGRGLLEATRSSELQDLAAECLATGSGLSRELSLFLPAERWFQAYAAPLPRDSGVVLRLSEVTELRRLERVRKDFVANVSHELRTPVQMVKGFSETLLDGALGDPEQARRFVEIIGRNASRMESLIADLLSLASLEREGGMRIEAEKLPIAPILESARQAILPKAEARGSSILVDCPAELEAPADPGLLEQAVVNLVDNAVKYSPPGSPVSVRAFVDQGAEQGETSLVIEVRDKGIGIPARDLSRLFERFYRVDSSRSRELGGTGLGLAIVRHIAMAHGGSVSVESWEGEGSTFRIRIPL